MVFLRVLRFTTLTTIFATSLATSLSESVIPINSTCNKIAISVSAASDVYFPGSPQYSSDNFHFANSSSQESACSVEPGTPEDVGIILQILGNTRTAFGVKGGGHAFNPNFSSTAGVQIALSRFNQINVNKAAQTVEIGTGLIWDEVYDTLGPQNLTVIGGRVTGVGVAGLVLGGGLSYKTNEYGIAAANVVEFELVLPNGTVTTVDAESNPDLFFAVRGTQNNFGIVTSITTKLIPQGLIWGGIVTYLLNATTIPSITAALIDFQDNVIDPKAGVNFYMEYLDGNLTFDAIFFYDGPEPPSGIFDNFLAIPSLVSNISTMSYSALTLGVDANVTLGYRTADDHIMVEKWTPNLFNAIINETVFWSTEALKVDPNSQLPYIMEFFLPTMFQHGDPGAWPPQGSSSPALMPLAMQWSWTSSPDTDNWFINSQRASVSNLLDVVASEGLNTSLPRYINYALTGTPVADIWGEDNIARLQKIQTVYDPDDVMGLTGGFKVPKVSTSALSFA